MHHLYNTHVCLFALAARKLKSKTFPQQLQLSSVWLSLGNFSSSFHPSHFHSLCCTTFGSSYFFSPYFYSKLFGGSIWIESDIVQLSQHHWVKRLSFPHFCLLSHRLTDHRWVGLFLVSILSHSVPFSTLFLHQYHAVLITTVWADSLKSRSLITLALFFLKIALAIQSFKFPHKF